MMEQRDLLPFAVDGVVAELEWTAQRRQMGAGPVNPHWVLACKFPPDRALTRIVEIIWTTGATGKRTPVAVLDPVEIRGRRIGRLNLHNADYL